MSNMYDFVTKKQNPLGGECIHQCGYCYMNPQKKRFAAIREKYTGEPRIYEKELHRKFKETDTVFVVNCADLFAQNVPFQMVDTIIAQTRESKAKFIFQTKNPAGYNGFVFPGNCELGVTIESDMWHVDMGNAPDPSMRFDAIERFQLKIDFVTIEPIMKFTSYFAQQIKSIRPKQVNIGADSSKNKTLLEPTKEEILQLIDELKQFTTVHLKTNLQRLIK